MAIHLIESTRQEALAEALVGQMYNGAGAGDALMTQTVVVQNAGLGRWLRLWHAKRCGISAAVKMPFAQSFIARYFEQVGLFERTHELTVSRLRWQLFDLLQGRCFEDWAEAKALKHYLAPDKPQIERRAWSLAGRLAELYDRYAVHRPTWVLAWLEQLPEGEEGLPHLRWQARLFVEVIRKLDWSRATLEQRWLGLALYRAKSQTLPAPFPNAALHVFGISAFPAAFLQFFRQLGERREVFLYHLIPSEAYLGELPKHYRAHLLEDLQLAEPRFEAASDLHNPLLVANGQTAARFQSLLLALDYPVGEMPVGAEVPPERDLARLQDSLRMNAPYCEFSGDGSLSLHSCHSRMREVQTLQQQLLALFAADASLEPRDVMVLVPEISEYSDAIEAVFGAGTRLESGADPLTFPYCIADQRRSESESCWRFLGALLGLLRGRQLFSEVVDLLDFDPVCQRLSLDRAELKELLSVLHGIGIRWGINAAQRREQGLPEYAAYSWDYGFQWLYEGLILGNEAGVDTQRVPLSEGMRAGLGSLAQVLGPIFQLAQRKHQSLSFQTWSNAFLGVLRQVLGENYAGGEWMREIAVALGTLRAEATETPIALDTFCKMVEEGSGEASGPSGLLRRGITFCRMQPARHVPARVLCILGLNEGAYPRRGQSLEFDLIDLQRRAAGSLRGGIYQLRELHFLSDVQLRDEDRQLFIDCLSNARDHLYLSYVGQSDVTNESLPPSLLVSELMQFLLRGDPDSGGTPKDRERSLERIHLKHTLQDWSKENFLHPQPKLGSPPVPIHFNATYGRLQAEPVSPRPFLEAGAEAADAGGALISPEVSMENLVRFLKDPAKVFLKQQMAIRMDLLEYVERFSDEEALELDSLAAWQLRQDAFTAWLFAKQSDTLGRDFPAHLKERWSRDLKLPPGHAGEAIWEKTVEPVVGFLNQQFAGAPLEKKGWTQRLCGVRVEDVFWENAEGERLIFLNGGIRDPKYLLEAFIHHAGAQRGSLLVDLKESSITPWDPLRAGAASSDDTGILWLENVLRLWQCNQGAPIPFSPRIAYAFVQRARDLAISPGDLEAGPTLTAAYEKHWQSFNGANQDFSEAQALCFDGESPASPMAEQTLRRAFMENAVSIFNPILNWLASGNAVERGAD